MPINVTHDVDPRALAAAAYRIGRGGAYLRERKRYDDREQEWYNRQSDDYNRQWQQYQNEQQLRQQEYANQFSQEQEQARRAESERNFYEPSYADQQRSEEFAATLRDNRAYRDQQIDFQQHQEKMRTQAKQREVEAKLGGKFQYTPEQESQRNDLLSRRQNVVSMAVRGEILPEERDQALTQIDAEIDSIRPEFQQNQGPTPQDIIQERFVQAPDGTTWIANPDGKGDFKYEKVEDESAKAQAKESESIIKVEWELRKAAMDAAKDMVSSGLITIEQFGATYNNIYNQIRSTALPDQQSEQPDIAEPDPGADQNGQMRQQQLGEQMLQAEQSGDKETARAIAMQMLGMATP